MTQPDIRVSGPYFLDRHGRQMTLRGVNLGGDCKVPWPGGGTENPSDFSDHRTVSFIGRPFPLDEADGHLARIKSWGFNVLRLLTTWEAVEHAGPGQYDEAYLDYFAAVARKAGEHGLAVFIDFHQDVWARMSGGDGAPGWTFEAAGLDIGRFHASEAAIVMQNAYDYGDPTGRQAGYPTMVWSSNYRLPANGVMWSLFWGGRTFTPEFEIDGVNIQDHLQGCYLGAMDAVAERVAGLANVIGFDSLNEPGIGWVGLPLSRRHLERDAINPLPPPQGPALSPLDQLKMLSGQSVTVPLIGRGPDGKAAVVGERTLNAAQVRVWAEGLACPFKEAGVWENEEAFQAVDITEDAYAPFFEQVAATLRARNPGWALFAEMDPYASIVGRTFPKALPENTVNASHWYDSRLLHSKDYDASADPAVTSARYVRQMNHFRQESTEMNEGAPTLIGEFGIPYDLDHAEAYQAWDRGERDGIWAKHEAALSAMYDALDQLQIHSTQWNYTASNRNDLRIGDRWNQEDLSIYSADQVEQGKDGARALAGFCRPYAQAVQGRLVELRFDRAAGEFRLTWDADPDIAQPTEVFAPAVQFPRGFTLEASGCEARIEGDRVLATATEAGRAELILRRN
jgi:hypothetical protein